MTSSFEFPAVPVRLSDAERDQALQALREGAAVGKLSHDTFLRRMELVLAARRPDELAALTADLTSGPDREGPVQRALFGGVRAVSGFTARMRKVWQVERLPVLRLPAAPTHEPLRIGREPGNGLRLSHETVSRVHAELIRQGGIWVLRDLGSSNGTCVNGRRVIGAAVVQEGDQVSFGQMSFRLSAS
ncbi:FHA domain-containing protein [Streptomyces physcomitrii]|uniref:FHA domain-containing protein n=1 Tax=Streptomyces physcomitrii TaxID=2724184 RepID=A0ABX1H7Z5_9ACTN|nr:DUF1707 and FHA domain-containing protein [Streptomyces physcomitrii]NKI44496.1 FHA domain-containing protein [Streptomyces physcomitrii]